MRISSISPLDLHSTPFSMNSVDSQNLWPTLAIPILLGYFLLVRLFRYRRADLISSVFGPGKRPLSSMTTQEAFSIMQQLQQLEFPHAMNKARTIALLKVCHECIESRIPRAKLFSSRRPSLQCPSYLLSLGRTQGRTQETCRGHRNTDSGGPIQSEWFTALHGIYSAYELSSYTLPKGRKDPRRGPVTHFSTNVVEIFNIVDRSEWRKLSAVEKCAVGIFHKILGEDMLIPYSPLPSSAQGWTDGLHFANELYDWTIQYEELVAKPVPTGDQYVRVYVDGATAALPAPFTSFLRKVVAFDLDETMRISLK